jgi:DNA repair protein RecN (Recombination protein N)
MIERFYLKNCLSFENESLEFDNNLIIFTGPSGAGKSILMDALLSLFGLKESFAELAEATIVKNLALESIGIEEDEPNIFKLKRDKSTRYFINNQQISKKNLTNFSKKFINYLTLRDLSEFESRNLLTLLDAIAQKDEAGYHQLLEDFNDEYKEFNENSIKLQKLREDEKKLSDLKEFALFEIKLIEDINPKVEEYDELLIQKKELSKKEKLEELLDQAEGIFTYESKVIEALSQLETDSSLFDEAMNDLRVKFEDTRERLANLNELDIDEMLDRLDKLSTLKNKYGSIEESLAYLQKKKEELQGYENISFELSDLQKRIKELEKSLKEKSSKITKARQQALKILEKRVNHYLNLLHLNDLNFDLQRVDLHSLGVDEVEVNLKDTPLSKVSSGELNRIRLALLAAKSEFIQSEGGVLILDEIDANLSGKESMSVAKVLEHLSKSYQIFAISHQPQLSSIAQMHFLVYKDGKKSKVKLLKKEERIDELSRMISGEKITKEAREFAISLLS